MKRKKELEDEEVVDLDRQRESLKSDLQTMLRELERPNFRLRWISSKAPSNLVEVT